MKIEYNAEKISKFSQVLMNHSLESFAYLSKYHCFEHMNLTEEVKMKMLRKMSVCNRNGVPDFAMFWEWARTNFGMVLAEQLASFIYPDDEKMATYTMNQLRSSRSHSLWKHIESRFYKKWCSILTEGQCVYAVSRAIWKKGLDWSVLASPELDAVGVDFVLVLEDSVVPVQIKKDTFSRYASNKKNYEDNFARYPMTKRALKVLLAELDSLKIEKDIGQMMLLKYALPDDGLLPYDYLSVFKNGFVYFKGEKLINIFHSIFEKKVEIKEECLIAD